MTSSSDPILVDFLPVHALGLPGRVGMTIAPGKRARGVSGQWNRDLRADLWRLRDVYRTSLLVSLVETHERGQLGITELPQAARDAGLEFVEFPIPDGGVPTSIAELARIVRVILAASSERRNVVVHCRGGLGRSGLIAAACLVARGGTATDAIALTKAARRGAIETPAQERFLHEFEASVAGSGTYTTSKSEDDPVFPVEVSVSRFVGCLLGGALGDALGYPIEFESSWQRIIATHGSNAPATLRYAGEALISDDTQMTLFTAEGILRSIQRSLDRGLSNTPNMIRFALLRWFRTQEPNAAGIGADDSGKLYQEPRLHAARAPGNTNMSALREQLNGGELPTVEHPPKNNSKGCGAVMRSAPVGLAASSREEAFITARDAAVVTHGHPSGYLSAACFASIIHDVARDVPLPEALANAEQLLLAERGHEEVLQAMLAATALARSGPPSPAALETLGGGWVGEQALAIAIACALTVASADSQGFADAVWRSVVLGGDSDSTGSLTGNLLGAMYGDLALPERWVNEVELHDVVDRIARDLHASTMLGTELDREWYPPN